MDSRGINMPKFNSFALLALSAFLFTADSGYAQGTGRSAISSDRSRELREARGDEGRADAPAAEDAGPPVARESRGRGRSRGERDGVPHDEAMYRSFLCHSLAETCDRIVLRSASLTLREHREATGCGRIEGGNLPAAIRSAHARRASVALGTDASLRTATLTQRANADARARRDMLRVCTSPATWRSRSGDEETEMRVGPHYSFSVGRRRVTMPTELSAVEREVRLMSRRDRNYRSALRASIRARAAADRRMARQADVDRSAREVASKAADEAASRISASLAEDAAYQEVINSGAIGASAGELMQDASGSRYAPRSGSR